MDEKDYAIAVLGSREQIDAADIKKSLPHWMRCVHADSNHFAFRLDRPREVKDFAGWLCKEWRWSGVYVISLSGWTGEREPWDEWHEEQVLTVTQATSTELIAFYESELCTCSENGEIVSTRREWMLRYGDHPAVRTRLMTVMPPTIPDRIHIDNLNPRQGAL